MTVLIEANFRLTTPLFCGGATSGSTELRLPSFKGVLRFWWRALAWRRLNGDLDVIQRQEDLLFGSASAGQGCVALRLGSSTPLKCLSPKKELEKEGGGVVGPGARYLGYGLMAAFANHKTGTKAGELSRSALLTPLEFMVQLRLSHATAEQQHSLLQALIALGTHGGMGSRSRRGYGSLALQSLTIDHQSVWTAPTSPDELAEIIKGLLEQKADQQPPPDFPAYTALSSRSRVVLLTAENDNAPLELLDLVGREMVRFRSWGKGGKILNSIDTERNFTADHDLMAAVANGGKASRHPERIAFGLPHNYGKGKLKEVSPAGSLDRRASPLFIHIHQCGSRPVAVVSFLPSRFLPAKGLSPAKISVGGHNVDQKPETELYLPIDTFLDRLLNRIPEPRHRKEPFTSALEVKP